MVRLRGIEPPHTVPETIALSTELQARFANQHINKSIITHLQNICKEKRSFLSLVYICAKI